MAKQETTTTEIMEFLQEHMVTKEDAKLFVTKEDAKNFATKEDLRLLEKGIRTDMATKNDLSILKNELLSEMDDKLADLKGDLIILMRKEDRKMATLINILAGKNVITSDEARIVLAMEPFPQS